MSSDLDEIRGIGAVSVPLAWAMLGSGIFILFLMCYFCQKKLRDEEERTRTLNTPPREVYVIPSTNRQLQVPPQPSTPLPSPPPDYGSVVKKGIPAFQFDCEPPSYETAVCHDMPHITSENSPCKADKQSSFIEKNS